MSKKRRMEYLCLLGAGILLLLLFAALIYLRDHFPKDICEDDFFRIQQIPAVPRPHILAASFVHALILGLLLHTGRRFGPLAALPLLILWLPAMVAFLFGDLGFFFRTLFSRPSIDLDLVLVMASVFSAVFFCWLGEKIRHPMLFLTFVLLFGILLHIPWLTPHLKYLVPSGHHFIMLYYRLFRPIGEAVVIFLFYLFLDRFTRRFYPEPTIKPEKNRHYHYRQSALADINLV